MSSSSLLHGFRVLDLSQYIPGPFATRQLADMGAEVIKIEAPGGDPMRRFMGVGHSDTPSPFYRHLNRGKTIAFVDLKSNPGKQQFSRLLAEADVLLESFRPGALQRLGFDQRQMRRLNPGLVHCALSGFGQTGPYRGRAGHDLTYCAISGALGVPTPSIPPTPLADHAGAMQAVTSILAALLGRSRSGQGCHLDVALNESILAWQYLGLLDRETGTSLLRGGAACYNLYTTADHRSVALAALEGKFWHCFCHAIGHDEWIPRQAEALPQSNLIESLRQLFAGHPLAYWQGLLGPVDCCFEAVLSPDEVAMHPQLQARSILSGLEPCQPVCVEGQPPAQAPALHELSDSEPPCWQPRD